jgi:hypothetical protein
MHWSIATQSELSWQAVQSAEHGPLRAHVVQVLQLFLPSHTTVDAAPPVLDELDESVVESQRSVVARANKRMARCIGASIAAAHERAE